MGVSQSSLEYEERLEFWIELLNGASPDPDSDNLFSKRDFLPPNLDSEFSTTLTVIYCLLMLLSLIGNLLVIITIAKFKRLHTVWNIFLLSLAVSDLLLSSVNIPAKIYRIQTQEWHLGKQVCWLLPYLQAMTVACNIFTLMTISIDRYYAICQPLKSRHMLTARRAAAVTVLLWLVSAAAAIPQALVQKVVVRLSLLPPNSSSIPIEDVDACVEVFGDTSSSSKTMRTRETLFVVYWNVFIYLIPIVTTVGMYLAIGHKLWTRQAVGDAASRTQNIYDKRKWKVLRMLITVTLVFSLSWLPFFLVMLIYELAHGLSLHDNVFRKIQGLCQLLAFSNCVTNPLIYGFMNGDLWKCLKALVTKPKVCCSCKVMHLHHDDQTESLDLGRSRCDTAN